METGGPARRRNADPIDCYLVDPNLPCTDEKYFKSLGFGEQLDRDLSNQPALPHAALGSHLCGDSEALDQAREIDSAGTDFCAPNSDQMWRVFPIDLPPPEMATYMA